MVARMPLSRVCPMLAMSMMVLSCPAAAVASVAPSPSILFRVNGESIAVETVINENLQGLFTYDATVIDPAGKWSLLIDLAGDPDPTATAMINGIVQYTNTSSSTQDVEFSFDLPMCPVIVGDGMMSGSVTVKLTMDTDGGSLECQSGDALWSARMDAISNQDLFPGLFILSGSGKSTASTSSTFGLPVPTLGNSDGAGNFGLRQNFSISPGDKVRFTAMYVVTAAPSDFIDCEAVVCDLNGDSMVNAADLGLLLAAWDTDDGDADVNVDGTVDATDLGILLSEWS
jgi:hypothetical protein